MQPASQTVPASKGRLWAGRILSAIPIAMLVFSAGMKFLKSPSVLEGFAHYGYRESMIPTIAILELGCAIVYAIPRTSVFGAILVAAYLGGATATNVRVGDPVFIIPVLLGILAWLGLFFRDDRLRALLPLRSVREV
jgi:hypothetical protein